MGWVRTRVFCPKDDSDTMKHDCHMLQEYQELFDGNMIATWTKCDTCGHEEKQVILALPRKVEVSRTYAGT